MDDINSTMDFPTLLRKYRERRGLSQAQLAEKIGVARSGISMIETGERTPEEYDTIMALADILDLTPDERSEYGFLASVAHVPDATARAHLSSVWLLQEVQQQRLDRLHALVRSQNQRLDRIQAMVQTVLARSKGDGEVLVKGRRPRLPRKGAG